MSQRASVYHLMRVKLNDLEFPTLFLFMSLYKKGGDQALGRVCVCTVSVKKKRWNKQRLQI